jgi:hypothetical protein
MRAAKRGGEMQWSSKCRKNHNAHKMISEVLWETGFYLYYCRNNYGDNDYCNEVRLRGVAWLDSPTIDSIVSWGEDDDDWPIGHDSEAGFLQVSGHGSQVNKEYTWKAVLVFFGLFGIILAIWDIFMIICGIVSALSKLGDLDSGLWRGVYILVCGIISMGVAADFGIAAGVLSLLFGLLWIVLGIIKFAQGPQKPKKVDDETKEQTQAPAAQSEPQPQPQQAGYQQQNQYAQQPPQQQQQAYPPSPYGQQQGPYGQQQGPYRQQQGAYGQQQGPYGQQQGLYGQGQYPPGPY